MALPADVQLVAVTCGSGSTFFGEDATVIVEVAPVLGGNLKHLVHKTTGSFMTKSKQLFTGEPGQPATFTVPNSAQPETWVDGTGSFFTGWAYLATIIVRAPNGETERWTKGFTTALGQTAIDLDLVPDGQIGGGTSSPVPPVTSVNGQAGAVTIEGGAALTPELVTENLTSEAVEAKLPERLSATALNDTIGESVGTLGTPARDAIERIRIAPSLSPITERMERLRLAVIQEPGAVYATYSRVGEVPAFQKSVNGGTTWTTLSTMPGVPVALAKLKNGTILAVEEKSTVVVSNPKVWRSANDGVTWAEVPAGLNFGPLSAQGICEGTDGSILIAEYGNVAFHQYRVRRSTDDGMTWATTFSSDGVEPSDDVGHIHSVTYDHVAGRHIIFNDRPGNATWGGPRIFSSADNGATWQIVGESTHVDHPNFVTPMYFADYIAWGTDNQINGRISRIKRTDFYAGSFDMVETVAMLSQKAFYSAFPLRPDVWAVAVAGEHIISPEQTGGPGSTMNEVWLVSDNGSLVSGGMESYHVTTDPGSLSGVRPTFPARIFDRQDHGGFLWANMPTGRPRAYAAVPATQGWEPPSKRIDSRALPFLPPRVPLTFHRDSLAPDDIVRFIEYVTNTVILTNDKAGGVLSRAELRFDDTGDIRFVSGNVVVATLPAAGAAFQVSQRLDFAANAVGIRVGGGSPEGVVTAPAGTIWLNWAGGGGALWAKETGSGNTGWKRLGHMGGITSGRPETAAIGDTYGDYQTGQMLWWNGTAWIDSVVTTSYNTTGLTSAQIDALLPTPPLNGQIISDPWNKIMLVRQVGKWSKTAPLTVID